MRVRAGVFKSFVQAGGGWMIYAYARFRWCQSRSLVCTLCVHYMYFELGSIEASLLVELTKVHHCSYSTHSLSSIYLPVSTVIELKLDKHSLLKNNSQCWETGRSQDQTTKPWCLWCTVSFFCYCFSFRFCVCDAPQAVSQWAHRKSQSDLRWRQHQIISALCWEFSEGQCLIKQTARF